MAELSETRVRSIIREELSQLKIFDLPTQVAELRGEIAELRTELRGEINKVDEKIDHVRTELKAEIQSVRTELIGEISKVYLKVENVRTELKGDIAKLDAKVDGIQSQNDRMFKTMITFFIITIGTIITAISGLIALVFQITTQ